MVFEYAEHDFLVSLLLTVRSLSLIYTLASDSSLLADSPLTHTP
jgi:hypothetical protein